MSYTLQLLNSASTVVFDFNDPTGANNPYGLKTFCWEVDYGSPTGQPSFTNPSGIPGGQLLHFNDELVPMTWKQSLVAPATIDQFRAATAEMFRLLRTGGTLKEQGASSETVRYIDFEYSPLAAMLRGQPLGAVKLFSQMLDPDGLPLSVMRQPYFRRASLASSSNYVANGSLTRDSNADGRPDSWSWSSTTGLSAESIDAASESYQFTMASSANRDLYQDTAAASAAPSDIWTVSYEVRLVSGSSARSRPMIQWLNSSAAQVGSDQSGTLTVLTTSWQRVSLTTAAAPASTDRVRAIARSENSDATANVIQIRRVKVAKSATDTSFISGSMTVSNDPAESTNNGRTFPVFIQGSAPTPVQFTVTPTSASSKLQRLLLGVRPSHGNVGENYLTDYLNTTKFFQCESGTLTNSTTSVADANASGGNCARCTPSFSRTDTALKRVRISQTTKLDSLRGRWNVYLRCANSAAGNFGITLKWGASTADPAPNILPEVVHDTTTNGLSTYGYSELFLGQINVPDTGALSGVAFELWVRARATSAGTFSMDCISLVPADLSASIDAPYVSRISRLGKDMSSTDSVFDGNAAILDANAELAGIDMGTLAAGRYRVTFRYSIESAGASTDLELRASSYTSAYNFTTNIGTPVVSHHETSVSDVLNAAYTLEFDAGGSTQYRIDAELDTANGATISIHQIDVETLPYVAQNEQVYTDPTQLDDPNAYKRDSSGNLALRYTTKGPPVFWMEPGLNIVHLSAFEPVRGGLYSDLASELSRSFTVAHSYSPRDLA